MKQRLDQLLVDRGLFPTRSRAQASILAGEIYVNGQRCDKAGTGIDAGARVEVRGTANPYVSRGGLKLEKALKEFQVQVAGRAALDIGASTGGFTDCLLQAGAAQVYAIDVGYGQLDWKLRNDPRVVVIERTNVRYLTPEKFKDRVSAVEFRVPDLAVIDVSFISLSKILPVVYNLLAPEAEVIALIKPQFEAGRGEVGKGGIVRDETVRQAVIEKVKGSAIEAGFRVGGLIESPIKGADGNVEYLIYFEKGAG